MGIGIRKMLDFIFTRDELKVLDDIMPEFHRKKQKDDEEEVVKEEERRASQQMSNLKVTPSGNLSIPLSNGSVMKVPPNSINTSEEVNKSGIWHQVDSNNKSPSHSNGNVSKRNHEKEKESASE